MAGIVYHANYLKYIERARSDWVRTQGVNQTEMREKGQVFVVRRLEAEYLAPARFDDILEVHTDLREVSGARLVMQQRVCRDGNTLFMAEVTAVCVSLQGHPTRLPAALRRNLH